MSSTPASESPASPDHREEPGSGQASSSASHRNPDQVGSESAKLTAAEADALLMATMLTPEGRQDPYPNYRALSDGIGSYTSAIGAEVFTGYDDCQALLRNPAWGRDEPDMERPPNSPRSNRQRSMDPDEEIDTMLFLNPPKHTRLRGLVSRAFTPRRVDGLRDSIETLLAPRLDELAEAGEADLIEVLAVPFPVAVISALLGVPQDLDGEIRTHVRASTALVDIAASEEDSAAAMVAVAALDEIFTELLADKRNNPGDDLLTGLLEVEADGDRLSERELLANALLMYAAGFETTSNLIGNGLWMLLRHPEQFERVRRNPSLVPSLVQEILRFDSPVQLNGRTALSTTDLFGQEVDRGAQTVTLLGAANRDPAKYDDPDTCNVARFVADGPDVVGPPAPPPLSFGWGVHHCLGAHLALAEGEIVFSRLLERFGSIELAGDAPRYRDSFTLRGLESLNIRATS